MLFYLKMHIEFMVKNMMWHGCNFVEALRRLHSVEVEVLEFIENENIKLVLLKLVLIVLHM